MSINYLLLLVGEEFQEKIIKKFGKPKINIFLENYNSKIENSENFSHIKLLYCNYDKTLINQIPPIDGNILSRMESYSQIYFKSCARKNIRNKFITYEEIIDSYHQHIRYWNWKIDESRLTHLISYNIPHEGADYIIYALCKIKGIKTFTTYRLPIYPHLISKRYFVEDISKHKKDDFNKKYNYFGDKEICPENLELSFQRLFKFFYPSNIEDDSYSKKERPNRIAKFKKSKFKDKYKLIITSYQKVGFKKTLIKVFNNINILKKISYRNPFLTSEYNLNKYYDENTTKIIPNKPFIFLALHFQPELSSDVLGGFYSDQNLVVDMLASVCNKYDLNLIIKRHPRKDERSYLKAKNIYQKMNQHKNVFFIPIEYSTNNLIKQSIATASITGSVCWENFLRGKPSILFGSIIFENAPGTFKIKDNNDLEKAIKLIINKGTEFTKKDILNYLKYLEKYTFDCTHKKLINAATFSIEESSINFVRHLENLAFD